MLVASPLPDIIFRQFAVDSPAWVPLRANRCAACWRRSLWRFRQAGERFLDFILALAALRLGWSVIMPTFVMERSHSLSGSTIATGLQHLFVGRVLARKRGRPYRTHPHRQRANSARFIFALGRSERYQPAYPLVPPLHAMDAIRAVAAAHLRRGPAAVPVFFNASRCFARRAHLAISPLGNSRRRL